MVKKWGFYLNKCWILVNLLFFFSFFFFLYKLGDTRHQTFDNQMSLRIDAFKDRSTFGISLV